MARDEPMMAQERADVAVERDKIVKLPEGPSDGDRGSLVDVDRARDFRGRWESIQADFVDEPRDAVERADGLVGEVIDELQRSFADARSALESAWRAGEDASTEALRQALRRYRSFFDRLLST